MALTSIVIALALASVLAAPRAAPAFSMVAAIETQSHGALDCGNAARGHEGTQVLLGISDEIVAAGTNLLSGDAGQVSPQPLVVIKELDRCSPPLFTALVRREWITRIEIRLFDRQGLHFFTIRLENALVTRIARVVRNRGLHEEVAFSYRGIHLIDERTGISASHDFGG
jgi:type VI secretion system secreted protein Hcp